MSHVASAALVEALNGSGLYTEERNLGLWQQVPAELRLTEFSPRTLPDPVAVEATTLPVHACTGHANSVTA